MTNSKTLQTKADILDMKNYKVKMKGLASAIRIE